MYDNISPMRRVSDGEDVPVNKMGKYYSNHEEEQRSIEGKTKKKYMHDTRQINSLYYLFPLKIVLLPIWQSVRVFYRKKVISLIASLYFCKCILKILKNVIVR